MRLISLISSFLTLPILFNAVSGVPYEQYILAPSSRTLYPASVHATNGTISNAASLAGDRTGNCVFHGASSVTFDYGKNIAGVVTLTIGSISSSDQFIGITFSESSLWISSEYSDATADGGRDETLWFQPTSSGQYTVSREHERGGFRYLTLVHNSTGSLEVTRVETHFTPMPHYAEDALRNYTGYFHSNDELLNRIWYAGAYTNQLCTIDPKHGNALVHLLTINASTSTESITWYNNYTVTNGTSCLVDGAKRDRLVWAGDMSIAVPGIVVSTNDLVTIQNSLNSLLAIQNRTSGQLPYAGIPFSFLNIYSATYHLYTLIGVADYYMYSNDVEYLGSLWDQFKLALHFSLSFIDESGMMNVTSAADWLRFGMGGHNIEANSILYYTINQAITLATALNDTSIINSWQSAAAGIKFSANRLLWNSTAGMYHDNETTTLMPQDGNSWAVVANLTENSTQIESISANLGKRWTPYGAPAVEADNAISPFISGFELQAHFLASNATAALDLMRLQWGFMLDDERMTNSTFIEGYDSSGALHYAPYLNDARISHAHGWATGPTSSLSFYTAGIQLLSPGGKTWRMAPALGNLTSVEAGFRTSLGMFSAKTVFDGKGGVEMEFEAPEGTTGEIKVPNLASKGKITLHEVNGVCEDVVVEVAAENVGSVDIRGLVGGSWRLKFTAGT